MKLSELMAGITPNADYEGYVMADNMVLAVNTAGSTGASSVGDYSVVQVGVEGVESSLNAETNDKQYIRAGKSTTKKGTQRKFSIKGDRYAGDDFQDYALSETMKYAVGQACVVDYVYFNYLTGKGEKGKASLIVNTDAGGNAGDNSTFDIELSKSGDMPEAYTWSASTGGGG